MALPEVAFLNTLPASVPLSQTQVSPTSSLTQPSPGLNERFALSELERISLLNDHHARPPNPRETPDPSTGASVETTRVSNNQTPSRIVNRWNAPLPAPSRSGVINKYPSNLTPNTSPLRPACQAAVRLRTWTPAQPTSETDLIPTSFTAEDQERVKDLLANAWQESTKISYASGLLTYHVFCDRKNVDELARAPASTDLIIAFISTLAGTLAGSTISNYVSGIRTWHIIHNVVWNIDQVAVETALRAAIVSAPHKSSKPPRQPVTVDYLSDILSHLNKDSPLDAAIAACITTTFWSVSRLGEFTVPTISKFSSQRHATPNNTSLEQDRNGLQVRTFRLPFTKSAKEKGESTSWARQQGPSDPWDTFDNHIRVNAPPPSAHIFAYQGNRSRALTPLTKRKVVERLKIITSTYKLPNFEGHGLRIGGTLEYLLRGIPFEVVQSMGRWKSEAFQLYLREHAQILAPYLQSNPSLNTEFVRISMPPPR